MGVSERYMGVTYLQESIQQFMGGCDSASKLCKSLECEPVVVHYLLSTYFAMPRISSRDSHPL